MHQAMSSKNNDIIIHWSLVTYHTHTHLQGACYVLQSILKHLHASQSPARWHNSSQKNCRTRAQFTSYFSVPYSQPTWRAAIMVESSNQDKLVLPKDTMEWDRNLQPKDHKSIWLFSHHASHSWVYFVWQGGGSMLIDWYNSFFLQHREFKSIHPYLSLLAYLQDSISDALALHSTQSSLSYLHCKPFVLCRDCHTGLALLWPYRPWLHVASLAAPLCCRPYCPIPWEYWLDGCHIVSCGC